MCYGDIEYGHDGYAREEWERGQEEFQRQQNEQFPTGPEGEGETHQINPPFEAGV